MEALICSITAAGPAANRPPHMRFALPVVADGVNPSSTVLPAVSGAGGNLMVKRVVPGLVGLLVAIAIVVWFVLPRPAVDPLSWSGGTDSSAVPPISGTVRNFTPTNPRRPAPIDTFHDAAGTEFNLQGFGDKVVVLNLWATWCAPCLKELPSLDRLQAQLGSDRFEVVAISVDR